MVGFTFGETQMKQRTQNTKTIWHRMWHSYEMFRMPKDGHFGGHLCAYFRVYPSHPLFGMHHSSEKAIEMWDQFGFIYPTWSERAMPIWTNNMRNIAVFPDKRAGTWYFGIDFISSIGRTHEIEEVINLCEQFRCTLDAIDVFKDVVVVD